MSIAKLAYLTSPDPGRYVFHYQPFGSEDVTSIELDPQQMKNILTAGVTIMLNTSYHRVPLNSQKEGASQ